MAFSKPVDVFSNVGYTYPGALLEARSYDERTNRPLGRAVEYSITTIWVHPANVIKHDTPGGIPITPDASLSLDQIRFRLTRDAGAGAKDDEWERDVIETLWFDGFIEKHEPPGPSGGVRRGRR